MSTYPRPFGQPAYPLDYERGLDAGVLVRFFNAVYAWMAAGLGVTALVAWYVSTQPQFMAQFFGRGTIILLVVAELALVWTISAAVQRINATVATLLFLLYAGLNGLMLSAVFLVYTHAAIFSAFIVSAGMFGAMSLYGFVTRRDLTRLGGFLFMGVVGLFLAMIVSAFIHSSGLAVLINFVGVAIFVGLTAYDTQRLKVIALQTGNDAALAARMSISGALALYLDFLNLFLFLLSIFGGNDRRR